MGKCIECQEYDVLAGRCKVQNWPKTHDDGCELKDGFKPLKKAEEAVKEDVDEEDTVPVIGNPVEPSDQVSWMIDWIEKQKDEDD